MHKVINVPERSRPVKARAPINTTIARGPLLATKRRDQLDARPAFGMVQYDVTAPGNLPHTAHIVQYARRAERIFKAEREQAALRDKAAREHDIMERKRDQWRTDSLAAPGRVYDALNQVTSDRVTLTGNSAIVWDAKVKRWVRSTYVGKDAPINRVARQVAHSQHGNRHSGSNF